MLIDEIEEALGGTFPDTLTTDLRFVLAFGFVVAAVATRIVMPQLIRKLDGAGITATDINKPEPKPEIPEMGGLGWLLGLYSGVFAARMRVRTVTVELLGGIPKFRRLLTQG